MDRLLRRATPIILLVLALLAWFEPVLLPPDRGLWLRRFILGVVCCYLAVVVIERQRMEQMFKELLAGVRRLSAGAGSSKPGAAEATADELRQACTILIGALERGGDAARLAEENLKRITGRDFGRDAAAWRGWLQERGG